LRKVRSLNGGDQPVIIGDYKRHVHMIVREERCNIGPGRPGVKGFRATDHGVGGDICFTATRPLTFTQCHLELLLLRVLG